MPLLRAKTARVIVAACLLTHWSVLPPSRATAQSAREAGFLAYARQVTVNGAAAAEGLTVLSNSRLRTESGGLAVVNLGQTGHLAVGCAADFLLAYSKADIGGRLTAGRVAITAPIGVAVRIATPQTSFASDGQKGTDVVLEIVNGETRVAALNSTEASLMIAGETRQVNCNVLAVVGPRGVEMRTATQAGRPTAAAQAGRLSPEMLTILIASVLGVGLSTAALVRQVNQDNKIDELLRRTTLSPVR